MQVLKPGEAIIDELGPDGATACGRIIDLKTMLDIDDPFEHLTGLDKLSAQLGQGQARMRRKQGVFRPRKMCIAVLRAWRIEPPPLLVVQFDNYGRKTTFPTPLTYGAA